MTNAQLKLILDALSAAVDCAQGEDGPQSKTEITAISYKLGRAKEEIRQLTIDVRQIGKMYREGSRTLYTVMEQRESYKLENHKLYDENMRLKKLIREKAGGE